MVNGIRGAAEPIQVLKYNKGVDPSTGRPLSASYIPYKIYSGLKSRISNTESNDVNFKLEVDSYKVRFFEDVEITYKDRVLIGGQTYEIDGDPAKINGISSNTKSTVIFIHAVRGDNV